MRELFVPFELPNLEIIQQELLHAIKHDYKLSEPHAFTYNHKYMEEHCPIFMEWLVPKLIIPVRIYRYYVTPPHQSLGLHIDGHTPTVPFGLNIPVAGTKNTFHTYYETEPENLEIETPKGYLGATRPKDPTKVKKIIDLEITQPYVINNEILHGVRNDSDEYRIMFTVRWPIHSRLYRSVEQTLNVNDIKFGPGFEI